MNHPLTIGLGLTILASAAGGCSERPEPTRVRDVGPARAAEGAPTLAPAGGGALVITRRGSQPAAKGPADNFTGDVTVEPLFSANEHRHASAANVTFTPGARSAWHSHPAGQTLVVTAGTGWVQAWGGSKQEVKPGDIVWTPPGVKHWHGATATEAMTHTALQESAGGKVVDWMEHVSDEQYRR